MKIRLPVHAALWRHPQKKGDYILLKATCKKDNDLLLKLFSTKKEWEDRNNREFFVTALLDLPYQRRTFKQNAAVWVLVTAIFESLEGRLPDEEEKYNLYLDLLDVYADRIPNRLNGGTRPIHISESNSLEGSRFIDGLLSHLATQCELDYGTQSTVQEVLQEWEAWRGELETDHADYADREQSVMLTEEEWREKHVYSEVSGRGGIIVRAHEQQHRRGWDEFLGIYPHLRGRVERARRLAGKLELEFKADKRTVENKPARSALENLVNEAMEA